MVQIAKFVAFDGGLHAQSSEEGIHVDREHTMLNAKLIIVAKGITIPNMDAIVYKVLDVGITL
jgi:hypothetical protein